MSSLWLPLPLFVYPHPHLSVLVSRPHPPTRNPSQQSMAFHSVAAGGEQRLFCDSDSPCPALPLLCSRDPSLQQAPLTPSHIQYSMCTRLLWDSQASFCPLQKVELCVLEGNWRRMQRCFIILSIMNSSPWRLTQFSSLFHILLCNCEW